MKGFILSGLILFQDYVMQLLNRVYIDQDHLISFLLAVIIYQYAKKKINYFLCLNKIY